jgi:hypothetical protein
MIGPYKILEKIGEGALRGKHFLDAPTKVRITRAGLVQVGRTPLR